MTTVNLMIQGLGFILYSPSQANHIALDEDYLQPHYWDPDDVQRHLQNGSIVGICTCTPGDFIMEFFNRAPSPEEIAASEFIVRVGLHNVDGWIVVRDLYDLMQWDPQVPVEQILPLPVGMYHVTACTNRTSSGRFGDHQTIRLFLQPVAEFPPLAFNGVPSLC